MHISFVQINIPQPIPQFSNLEIPQYEKDIAATVDKETKDKVDELQRQLKQIKEIDSLESVYFNDICIHLGLKFPVKFKCPMAQSRDNDNIGPDFSEYFNSGINLVHQAGDFDKKADRS